MKRIIKNASQITPEWLTETLFCNGHLQKGSVREISLETFQSFFADFYRIKMDYSPDAAYAAATLPGLPALMLLKIPFAENASALKMGRDEVDTYHTLFAQMPGAPLPRCFDSFIDTETGRSHLLLEDLSPTHFPGSAKEDISVSQWRRAVEALAEFHAFWWERDTPAMPFGAPLDEATLDEIEKLCREGLPKFFDALGAEITPDIRAAYEKTLEFYPGFWRGRLLSHKRNTLIHGDAHSWNILFPHDAEQGRAYLIDLATVRLRPATNDPAYLMALKWKRELRAQLEMPLLKYYHDTLVENGVQNFSWQDCLLDYRYSIITHLFTPVVQCDGGFLSPYIWQDNFRRITAAFEDLDCRELLPG